MTNEEIAKDLTIALVEKITNPTAQKALEIYQEILKGIGKTNEAITLKSIEEHLKKQDKDTLAGGAITGVAIAISIATTGTAFALGNGIVWFGLGLILYSIILFVGTWAWYKSQIKKWNLISNTSINFLSNQ